MKHLRIISPRGERGMTLIEVCLAMLILSVAALSAGQLFSVALRAVVSARLQTSATMLAVQKLEQLRALDWRWDDQPILQAISDHTTDTTSDLPAGGGAGLQSSPSGSLSSNTPGYVDFLDAHGRWVGTGTIAPRSAVFIRRWLIAPLPGGSADSLMLRVLATTVLGETQLAAGSSRRRLGGDALLTTVITRKAG